MSTIVLTSACIRDMLNGKALVFPPVVQVLARGFWKGGPKSGIRLRLSDSEFSSDRFALLPKCSINPQCFERWAVVRLTEYRNETFLAGAKGILVVNMELVAESCRVGKKLGEPVDFRPNPIGSVHTPQVMGKVVNKSGVSNFVKANGTAGKLADVIIAQQDETVKVVMFNQVVDRWYDQFVKGRQCRISNGKLSNRKDDKYPNVSRQVILQLESIVDFLETPVLLAKVGASPPRPDNCKRPISVCNENSETFVSKKVKCLENEAWPGQTDDNESEYSLVGTQISKVNMIVFRGCRCGKKLEEIVPNRYKCGFCNDEYPPNNLLLQSMLKLQVNDHRDEYHLVIYRELIERFFSLSVAIDKPEEEMVEMLFQKANTLQWRRFEFQVESGVSFETDKKCILLRPLDYVRYGWNLLRKLRQN